jgi:TetR/AcrR family tetracycline transcriptional repressor
MPSRKDEVLETALALLDDVGLDAITIRRLAERLGVQPGALYRHFASKRELIDAMVDRVVAEAPEAVFTGDWVNRVRSIAGSMRAGMLARRDGARLMATFSRPGPGAVLAWERFVEVFTEAGLSTEDAMTAVDTVVSYVNGYTIEEQARPGPDPGQKDRAFTAGLDLILDGIRTRLP